MTAFFMLLCVLSITDCFDMKAEQAYCVPYQEVARLQEKVLGFYREHARIFPWRQTTDRYAVMVSEIMLQQTQAERVVPRFDAWIERFPDPASLAAAPLRSVLELWSGLGYNARAERLHRLAKLVVAEYDGLVPGDPGLLRKLPGIGQYTSRSIPVFADNLDIATVDTNIRRIFVHELGLAESTTDRELYAVAEQLLPRGRSREWHNALMDYGALHLTARKTGIAPRSRQSTFLHSPRWYRGRILRSLLENGQGMTVEEVDARYGQGPHDIGKILDGMVRDGIIERYGDGLGIRIKGDHDE